MSVDEVRITLPLPSALMKQVDEARRGAARTAWIRGAMEMRLAAEGKAAPEPSLLDPEPTEPEVALREAVEEREAVAVAPRGHEQSVPLDGQTHPVRHLHRFKDTGRVLRYERGRAIPERQCECGVVAEN
jgi:hypothetical protein